MKQIEGCTETNKYLHVPYLVRSVARGKVDSHTRQDPSMDRPPMICRVLDSNKYNYFKKIALEVFWVVHLDVGSLISMQGNFLSHTRSLSHALPLYFCEFVNLFNYFVLTSTLKIKIIKKKNIQTENLNFISSTNE